MIEITSLLLFTGLGVVAGLLIGLLPGLGVSSTFLLLLPLLLTVSPVYSLFFFIALLAVSQYFGSITALVFGVPGELSSFPVLNERGRLLDRLNDTLKQTALGSLIGSVIALLVFLALLKLGSLWVYLYNYKVFSWVLAASIIAVVIYGSKTNGIILNAVLMLSGILLSRIGYDRELNQSWGTFGISDLSTGIPLAAVAMGLIVVPSMIHNVGIIKQTLPVQRITQSVTHWGSIFRGSLLGLIGGLVPGVTYMASTQLSYFVENRVTKNSPNRPMQSVISSSTADNAGATSSLYPLLWLGIPISLGEAMVVWLFDKHNQVLNLTTLSQTVAGYPLYWYLLGCFLLANVVAYLLSWPGRKVSIAVAQALLNKKFGYFVIALVLSSLYFLAKESYSVSVFYISFVVASILGLWAKRIDWMPLIMGMILGDIIIMTLFKLGVLSI